MSKSMACSGPSISKGLVLVPPRKPRILLAACGSVAAVKFGHLCHSFCKWAEVTAVVTKESLRFIDFKTIPRGLTVYHDGNEWDCWKKHGDDVLHIKLHEWADIMVIAPLSSNTLAKIAGGLCDNLLTCTVKAWGCSSKPLFVAPSMNTYMWKNSLTERHCMTIDELGFTLIPPVSNGSASGAMAEPSTIYSAVKAYYDLKILPSILGGGV